VVTGLERRAQPELVQPGDREWVTVIQSICAARYATPPFIIYKGRVHISAYVAAYPTSIVLRENGWFSDMAGSVIIYVRSEHSSGGSSSHALLIIDSHKSHCLVAFQDLCREKKIITLCMPLHLSHLLQPLNVACFSPLKRLYSDKISALARSHIHYINKETFLPAFKLVFSKAFTRENFRAGFRGARLVLHNLEVVLLKLNVRLRTLTPLKPSNVA
ncbi:DDE-domain-containing protein, partial [Didymella exigua CBS 183.55]